MANRKNLKKVAGELLIVTDGKTDSAMAQLILQYENLRLRDTVKLLSQNNLTVAILEKIAASENHVVSMNGASRHPANKKKRHNTDRGPVRRMRRQ